MKSNIIHLPPTATPLSAPYSEALVQSFITSCTLLDLGPFAEAVDRTEIFEDMFMNEFLDQMMEKFRRRRKILGAPYDYRFLCQQGTSVCIGCSGGNAKVVTFRYSTSDGVYMPECDLGYRIVWEEGILLDIFQCLLYR